MEITNRDSARLSIYVNAAKLTFLAALAPAVISGIAQKASALGDDAATTVGLTMSTGSICAVIGALGLGSLADATQRTVRQQWQWVLCAVVLGGLGIYLAASSQARAVLLVGWGVAQLGFSGAIAITRTILARARASHRQRGAVASVLVSYGGLLVPVVLLVVFPERVWETALGLAVLSLLLPAVLLTRSPLRPLSQREDDEGYVKDSGPENSASLRETTSHVRDEQPGSGRVSAVPRWAVLAVQFAANIVIAAFLAYQPLELAARNSQGEDFPVRASVLVVGAAIIGLVAGSVFLLWRPGVLSGGRSVLICAGAVLGASLIIRALSGSISLVLVAAALSGLAVGLVNSALFSAALEHAQFRRGGQFISLYSALGALGQFIGPMAALYLLSVVPDTGAASVSEIAGYRNLFVLLAAVPIAWAIGLLPKLLRPAVPSRAGLR